MRRTVVLTLMVILVALLLLGVGILRDGDTASSNSLPPEVTAAPAYEMMYERPLALLQCIEVFLPGGENYRANTCMAFDDTGRMLGVYSDLDQPLTIEGREDFALDMVACQMMLLTAQGIPATAHYPALDQSACGLTEPRARIRVRYKDGSEIELKIGSKTASGLSCYVSRTGMADTYLVPYDFYDVMTRSLNGQHRLPGAVSYNASDAVQLAIDSTEQGRILAAKQENDDRALNWQVTSPVIHDASDKAVERFVQGLCGVHAERYTATVYDADELEAYGLRTPVRYVAAFSDGTIRDLHVGRDAGEGSVYVRMDRTGDVYEISRSQLAFAADAALDVMMDRFVDLVPINTVRSVTIQTPNDFWLLEQDWTDDDATTAKEWTINGQAVEQRVFSGVYAALVGIQFDKTAAQIKPTEPIMTITYELRSGQSRQLVIMDHDPFFSAVTTSGGADLLVRRTRFDALLQALEVYAHEAK